MNYNDYQVLDENTYNLLRDKFVKVQNVDRKTYATKLYFELNSCLNFCFNLKDDYNKSITAEIQNAKNLLYDLIENLKANFTLPEPANHSCQPCNIFKIIKKLLASFEICIAWNKTEEKEYYKNLLNNFLNTLIKLNTNLVSALEISNIKFFKYM